MKKVFKKIWQGWDQFWFGSRDLKLLAIFRIILCGAMTLMALERQRDWQLFFSEQGIVPKDLALSIFPDFIRPYFVMTFWSDIWIPWVHALLIFSLLLLTLGMGGRLLTLLAWFLHMAFLQRNYSIAFGADVIGGIFLLYMAGTQACAEYSLWTKIFPKKHRPIRSDLLTNLFYQLILVQLCVIYAYTGFEKLKGASWWDGTALWSVLINSQMVIANMEWLRYFPWAVVFFTFVTILFEIYFPVLVWVKKLKVPLLLIGISFHMGIGVLMGLWGFALVMLAPYVMFLRSVDELKINKFR